MKLSGKVAVVTGGGRGIGRAIAEALVREGAKVLVCSRTEPELKEVVHFLNSISHDSAECFVTDVSQENSAAGIVGAVVKKFGRLDILVCAAGIYGPMGLFHTTDNEAWKKCLDINLFGTVNCIRSAIPELIKTNGCVVAIGGAKVPSPFPRFSAYSVSKAAIVQFIADMASEYQNARFFSIAPGAVNTNLVDEVISAGPEVVGQEFFDKNRAYKRGIGTVDASFVADFVVSIISSSNVSGRYLSPSWDKDIDNSPPYMFTLQRVDGRNFDKKI